MSVHVDRFLLLAERTMNIKSIRALLTESSFQEQVSFHRVHERLLELSKGRVTSDLAKAYPFVKIRGRWHFSTIAMYSYLRHAGPLMIMTKDKRMIAVFNAWSRMSKYQEECQAIFDSVCPTTAEDWREYTEKCASAYELALMEQKQIFQDVNLTPVL